MTKTTTTCDHCRFPIVPKAGMPHYFLRLTSPCHEGTGDIQYAVCVEPLLKESLDFCSRSCLAEYLKPKTETTP